MKKNKIINLILIILMIFITLLIFNNKVYAEGEKDTDVISNPGFYKPKAVTGEEELSKRVGVILGVVNVVGVLVSVITLMVLGIKYMVGSVEEKAEYKKTMGLYLIGAILVFSTTTIPNILYKLASNF